MGARGCTKSMVLVARNISGGGERMATERTTSCSFLFKIRDRCSV